MPTWKELQRKRANKRKTRERARAMEREADRAGAPEVHPAVEAGATLFQAGDRGALPIGIGAIPQGAWRILLNAPFAITSVSSNIRTGEYSPLKIGADMVSNVLANKEGVIASGRFFGRDVTITGSRPERLSFNEELGLWGVPELGRVSDIPILGAGFTPSGKGIAPRKKGPLDITGRSVLGLAGEVAATAGIAPSIRIAGTTVGLAKGAAGTIISKVTASKVGQRVFDALYNEELVRRFGPKAGEMATKMSMEVYEDVRDAAATRLFDTAHKAPHLIAQPELFIGPFRVGGSKFVAAAEKTRTAITRRLAGFEPYRKATDYIAQGAKWFERLFSVVPAAARRFPFVEETISRYTAGRRSGFQDVSRQWLRWSKGLDDDELDLVRGALDGVEGPLPEGLDKIAADIRNWHLNMADIETRLGYQFPERVNYIRHAYHVNGKPITKAQWDVLKGSEVGFQVDEVGRSIGGATKPRTYATYAEGIEDLTRIAREKGKDWVITPAPLKESILRRGFAHVEAVEYAKVEAAIAQAHGMEANAAAEQHFRTILPEIDSLLDEAGPKVSALYEKNAEPLRAMLERRGLQLLARRSPKVRRAMQFAEQKPLHKAQVSPELTAPPGEPGFVYHVTDLDAAEEIARSRLRTHRPDFRGEQDVWPDGSVAARSYWGSDPQTLSRFFAPGSPGKNVLLRTKRTAAFRPERGTGDIITHKPVPASKLEYLNTDGKWISLTGAVDSEKIMAKARQVAGSYAMRNPTKGILKRVAREDDIVKSFYLLQRMRQVTNAKEFAQLLADRPRLGELEDGIYRPLADYMSVGFEHYTNQFRDRFGKALVTFKGRTHTYYLPEPLKDTIVGLEKAGLVDQELMDALNVLDATTTMYKGLVTSHVPSFNTRNAYNNLATMYVELGARALDARAWMRSLGVMRGGEGTIHSGTKRFSFSQMRDAFRRYGILNNQDFALESAQLAPRNKILEFFPFRRGRQVGTFIENWAKATHMVAKVEAGENLESAAWRTQQILFDYDWLTAFEKKVMRRAFPFYTWYRKNRVLQAQFMVTRPGRLINIERLRGENFREQAPDQDALPAYLRGDYKLRFERHGNVTYVYGIDLPHRAFVDNLFTREPTGPGLPSPVRALTGRDVAWMRTIGAEARSLAPWLQGIMAVATGTDPQSGRSLREPYPLPAGTAAIMKAMPKPLQEWMEFEQAGEFEGEDRFQCNAAKAFLFFRTLALERVFWPVGVVNSAARRDSDLDNILLDIATGVKMETLDLSEVQYRLARERLKNAELRQIKAGNRRSFTGSFPVE